MLWYKCIGLTEIMQEDYRNLSPTDFEGKGWFTDYQVTCSFDAYVINKITLSTSIIILKILKREVHKQKLFQVIKKKPSLDPELKPTICKKAQWLTKTSSNQSHGIDTQVPSKYQLLYIY